MIKLRLTVTAGAIVIYLALFNLLLFELTHPGATDIGCKIFRNYLMGGMLLFLVLDWKAGFQNYAHQQINLGGFSVMIFQYGIVIANYYGIDDPLTLFLSFNSGWLLLGIILLFCSWKR